MYMFIDHPWMISHLTKEVGDKTNGDKYEIKNAILEIKKGGKIRLKIKSTWKQASVFKN